MTSLSRRRFLAGVASSPVLLALPRAGLPQTSTRVRHDAASPEGKQMLHILATAVAAMQARPDSDPLSWRWQWYTHFIGGATKPNEIARIFGTETPPERQLAEDMWNTCQSHAGQDPNNFLPWHRLLIFYFEQIIREVSGHPEFTLPYWNYTSQDPEKRGVVPLEFRLPDDPVFASLYRPNRTALANGGEPIHKDQAGDPMDVTVPMSTTNYSTVGSVQGFCRSVDSGIHGRIHVLTGTSTNMGSVPWAGRDPLFFVHHANIDRLWASWNRNGGKNPYGAEWAAQPFVFANAQGQRVVRRLGSAFSILDMGYTYDAFEPRPTTTTATALQAATTRALREGREARPERVAVVGGGVELRGGPTHAVLDAVGARRTAVLGLDPAQPEKRAYLVLKDLHAWKQPEVLFHVYLSANDGGGSVNRMSLVGNINFFDAEFHDHGQARLDEALGENLYSFDVTALLERIASSGARGLGDSLRVTIVPGGAHRGGRPMVGSIELVRQ